MTNPRSKDYDRIYADYSIPVLAQMMSSKPEDGDDYKLYRLVYEQKVIEQKHMLDLELLDKQADLVKSSNRIIAIATISAALLGAIVGAVLQYKLTQKTGATVQKTEHSSEVRLPGKVSLSHPK